MDLPLPIDSSIKSTGDSCSVSTSAKRAKLTVCAVILAAGSATFADCPIAWSNEPQVTAVEAGEPAPFAGDLYPVDVSVRWALEIEGCAERAALESRHVADRHAIELEKIAQIHAAEGRAAAARIRLLQDQIDADTAWYRSPAFVATAAASLAVATLLMSAFLLQSTTGAAR